MEINLGRPLGDYLSANDRLHWAARAKLTKLWRDGTAWILKGTPGGARYVAGQPYFVTVHLPVPDNRRRDPANLMPTVKAIVDGCTDAGFWPDDDPEWVTVREPVLEVGGTNVRVVLEPRP